MASPTRFPIFREGDLGIKDGPVNGASMREAFRRMFGQLNPGLDSANKATARGLSLSDNIKCDIIKGVFTHGVPSNFALTNLTKANSARVLSCDAQIPVSAPSIKMLSQQGRPQASVTLFFNSALNADGSPTSSSAVVELLSEGAQNTTVPTFFPATRGYSANGTGSSGSLVIGAATATWTDIPSTAQTFTAHSAARGLLATLTFSGYATGAIGQVQIRFLIGSFTSSPFNLYNSVLAQHQSWSFQLLGSATSGGAVGAAQACKAQMISQGGGGGFTMDANDSVSLVIHEIG